MGEMIMKGRSETLQALADEDVVEEVTTEDRFKDLGKRIGLKKEFAEFMATDNWRDTLSEVLDPSKGDSSERQDAKKLINEAESKKRSGVPTMMADNNPSKEDYLTKGEENM